MISTAVDALAAGPGSVRVTPALVVALAGRPRNAFQHQVLPCEFGSAILSFLPMLVLVISIVVLERPTLAPDRGVNPILTKVS